MPVLPGPSLSLLGAARHHVQFDRDPLGYMTRLRARYGNLVCLNAWKHRVLFAFGPEYNEEIHTRTDLFHSRPIVMSARSTTAQYRLRQSIFTLNEKQHHAMRHQLLPPFQRSALAGYFDTVVARVEETVRNWRPGEVRNIQADMHELVWKVVRKLLFGLDESEASGRLYEAIEHWMFKTFSAGVRYFPVNLPFTPYRRVLREAERLEQQFLALMRARRAAGANGDDVLSVLLRMQRPDGTPLPLEELVGHAVTLFLVAYETTGNTLTWTLFLLAQHPDVQHDLLDELAPWRGEAPPADRLDRLPVLDRVIKESVRILPAVPYNRRLTTHDGTIGPYDLPKKTRVIFSHYVTHHMPEIFPEPERFRPDRWLSIKPTPYEYLPFGVGVRTCLGSALAKFIAKITLAKILPAWRLTVAPDARIDRHLGISLGPSHGMPMVVARQDREFEVASIRGNIHDMVDLSVATLPFTRPTAPPVPARRKAA